MKALEVALIALDAALYAALGYLFSAVFPLTTPGLGLVRFWPQVIIPAVFAAVFGVRVGALGAGIGIFISDMLLHGNAFLSLMAGVSSNMVMFAIIGYMAKKKVNWKFPLIGLGGVTALLVWISYMVLVSPPYGVEYQLAASVIIVGTYIAVAIFVLFTKWKSYVLGSTLGLLVGSSIIAAMVPLFSEFFIMPGNTAITPLGVTGGLIYLIWTFSTEIPFLLALGPPIIAAIYRAFPNLRKETPRE
ncbi:MAG: hypothetical protein NWE84_01530 [Candidatus Bathyarchaeota archaeon]|nr:hypothetical protein [Candidatus Bathyarchaeota archaeon]